jgi:hypothetical protein
LTRAAWNGLIATAATAIVAAIATWHATAPADRRKLPVPEIVGLAAR